MVVFETFSATALLFFSTFLLAVGDFALVFRGADLAAGDFNLAEAFLAAGLAFTVFFVAGFALVALTLRLVLPFAEDDFFVAVFFATGLTTFDLAGRDAEEDLPFLLAAGFAPDLLADADWFDDDLEARFTLEADLRAVFLAAMSILFT